MVDHQPRWSKETFLKGVKRSWMPLAWLASIALVVYVFAITPFDAVTEILAGLGGLQISLLVLINLGIITLFGLRWWWILRIQRYHLPYLTIVRYRLAAFGISYFTPGPQFGGEPLQVYYLRKNHQLPTADSLASLSLDKLLELMANFTFLVIGMLVVFAGGYLDSEENFSLLPIILTLAALPWGYLLLLYFGVKPITGLSKALTEAWSDTPGVRGATKTIAESESQVSNFCQSKTLDMVGLMLVSGLVWLALVFEYWLTLGFLGVPLGLGETLVFITAARLAFLTPLPGGLGSLEISQVLAAQALGLGTEIGASIGLLIRIRDICFGLAGFLWGGILTNRY